ncbi:Gfo/Idh/MocA family oxidoreductase [Carnobacteriaceae bacterium zg-ZUI252]|nr:Gfo/Idh/MocA family oxidoreductase [Carnobacteriaceae bacterium zg-ZUI252]
MYQIGVVGTSQIVHSSVQAFQNTKRGILKRVYSRQKETGDVFASEYDDVQVDTNLDNFLNATDIDIVYIASPNTFHFEQAKKALCAKKHVVVEKPAVVTMKQWETLNQLATENNVLLFEAIRHVYEPNFQKVTEFISHQHIDGAVLQFGQYSRRMDDLHKGIVQNIFKVEMSAGVLMDLGVYVLHSAFHWFGIPNDVSYFPIKWSNGIDVQGDLLLKYDGFNVSGHISKRTISLANSEIYVQNKTLCIDSVDHVKKIEWHENDDCQILSEEAPRYRMQSQWNYFFDCLEEKANALTYYQKVHQITGEVIRCMEQCRQKNKIIFSADEDKE